MSSTNDYAGPGATQTGPGSYVLPSTTISTTVQPGNYFDKPGGFGGKVGANYAGSPDGFGITIKVRQKLNSTFRPLIKQALQEQSENYEIQLKSIAKTIEQEVSAASGNYVISTPKSDKDIERDISIRQNLIKNKITEVQSHTTIANSFYRSDFLSKGGESFFQEAIGRWGTDVSTPDGSFTAWLNSLNSAHRAKLLNEEIALLHKQIADLKVESEAVRVANTFPAQGSVAISHPLFTAARGTIAIEGGAAALATAIRSAIVGLAGLVAGAASSAAVGVIAFLSFPRELANGELPDRYTFSTPLADMAPDLDLQTLQQAAATTGTVELSIRVSSKTAEDGRSEVFAVQTDGVTVPSKVRVVTATYNAGQNVYTATTADVPPRTLTWTPAVSPGNSSTSLPAETALPPVYDGATITPVEGRIDTFPEVADASFDDYIMILPVGTGFVPVYVMFRDRREDPGVATGVGQPVSGIWLSAPSQGKGAPIPSHIADQLRGREFKSFRAFREALWKAVANDPGLVKQFKAVNLGRMKRGYAPYVVPSEQVGDKVKFELHHVIFLKNNGALYDIDNIRVVTPKEHIALHK